MGKIEALCVSEKKGVQKTAVEAVTFRENHGIEGDAHAGDWHRQASLLSAEDVAVVREKLPDIAPGAFAENVVVSGVDLAALGLGTRLRLGTDVVLRVSQIGKVCHTPCAIGRITGDCIMPRLGLFGRVESGGSVRVGDGVELVETVPRGKFQAVVLTVSDRCSRGEAEDTAGPACASIITGKFGAHLYALEVVPDDRETIAGRLRHYSDGHSIDLVLTVGGSGFAPRDVTPEATRDVVERLTPGLDEAMRAASAGITPHAMLSRGVSGIRAATLIVNLPGSKKGSTENLEALLPALEHGLLKMGGDPADCGRPPRV
ncbi:MAG: molybdenum cofactor synthesis domain-containing protein [Planctomycetota bacterium]|jgi:molybdenum cofactor synthesis domain-containing protein